MSNVSLSQNSVLAMGIGGYGISSSSLGGAIFTAGALMQLIDSKLVQNRATMKDPAMRASGGALHVGAGARISLLRSVLKNNVAGGEGYYQRRGWNYPIAAGNVYLTSALQIHNEGFVTLDDCDMLDDVGLTGFERTKYSMWFWIVSHGGAVQLLGSRFGTSATHSFDACLFQDNGSCDPPLGGCIPDSDYLDCGTEPPPASGPFGRLIMLYSPDARLEMRRCSVRNLTLHGTTDLVIPAGIVNSTIQPALDRSLLATVMPAPTCDAKVLTNQALCDPRATCRARSSGGVECACSGEGLRDRPGAHPDGGACMQDTSVAMLIQSRHMIVKVYKPGNHTEKVRVVVRVDGEQPLAAPYNMSMERLSSREQTIGTSAWGRVDEQQLSLDGHHVLWVRPPSNDSQFDLDLQKQVFSVTKEYLLQLRLDCGSLQPCIADGDKVTSMINIGDALSPSRQRAAVSITTEVAALVSCQRTVVWVEGGAQSVRSSSAIVVRLRAIDVDAMPIDQTRAEVEFRFGNLTLPVNWNRGSNEYVASVPAEVTRQSGEYGLVVTATLGWDENANQPARCVLFRRQIRVDEGFNSWLVLGTSACCCAVMVAGLVICVKRRSDQLRHVLTMVLAEAGRLIISICFELGDLVTDVPRPPLVTRAPAVRADEGRLR
jgi:hypothetical protein